MPLITSRPFFEPPALPGFADSSTQVPAGGFPTGLGSTLDQLDSSHFILVVRTSTGANNGVKAIVANLSGTTVTWGSWFDVKTVSQCGGNLCRVSVTALDSGRATVTWSETGLIKARTISITGTTITGGGTEVTLDSGGVSFTGTVLVDTDKVMATWTNTDTGDPRNRSAILTSTGTAIAVGSTASWSGAAFDLWSPAGDPNKSGFAFDPTKVLMVGGSGTSKGTTFSISGTTITPNTSYQIANWSQKWEHGIVQLDATRSLYVYSDGNTSDRLRAVVVSVSGTVVSTGSSVLISADGYLDDSRGSIDLVKADTDKVVVVYREDNTTRTNIQTLTISGTTVTPGTEYQIYPNIIQQGKLINLSSTQGLFVYRESDYTGVVVDYP